MKLGDIYKDFFQKTNCAVFILKDSMIHYANDSSLKLFGYTKEEILSLHPSDLSPLRQEDGEHSIIKADRMIAMAIENGNNMFEWQHIKKDGTIFWTEIVLTSIKQEEELFIFALVKDISERKLYQEELNFLISNITDFIYKIDTKGNITYVSKSVLDLTGYDVNEWKSDFESYIIDENMIKLIGENRKEILKNKLKNKNYSIQIQTKDDNKLILDLTESYYNSNAIECIIGVAKDVTEKYRNEMMLLKSQKMELISTLSSGLVHEFNNSLSVIIGNIDLIDRRLMQEDSSIVENIKNIKLATKKANETLNHLLTISNKQANSLQKLDLNELIINVFSILRDSFPKSIDLNLSIMEEEAIVNGDLSQLEHVLLNILINSYQAILNKGNFKGNIDLNLSKVTYKDKQEYWKIEIIDNGIGIPQNIIPMIFTPFFSTKDSGNELGLGLTSSRKILEVHNGFLEIDSKENEGTTVSIFIPVCTEVDNIKKVSDETVKGIGDAILLIDDEPLVLTTAKAILEEFGYTVLTALNGKMGVSTYKENANKIALVILDMDMPNKSGQEVFYELKEINDNIKVIISSGYENDSRVKDVLNNGVKEFLPKPYGISNFINKINAVLNN